MDNLVDLSYKSIVRYFNTLSVLGYKSYKDVYKLFLLLSIEDLLNGPLCLYISEEDYKTISNVLYCLFGTTCLIDYPEFAVDTSLIQNLNVDSPRITEDEDVRFSENEFIRLVNE